MQDYTKDQSKGGRIDRDGGENTHPVSDKAADAIGDGIEDKFCRLADEWKHATSHLSSLTAKSMHPAYQRIIGMGQVVVPFILRELQREPDHWFWALRAVTGEDPVLQDHRGRMSEMAQDWIRWGRDRGYIETHV